MAGEEIGTVASEAGIHHSSKECKLKQQDSLVIAGELSPATLPLKQLKKREKMLKGASVKS